MRMASFETVDDYIAAIESKENQAALIKLRNTIRTVIPDAEEVISYGMPMYKHHGMVAGFAAFKKHCSFFPGHTVADFTDELKDFKTSKGTVQFTPDKPIPDDIIRTIVKFRYRENEQLAATKPVNK